MARLGITFKLYIIIHDFTTLISRGSVTFLVPGLTCILEALIYFSLIMKMKKLSVAPIMETSNGLVTGYMQVNIEIFFFVQ